MDGPLHMLMNVFEKLLSLKTIDYHWLTLEDTIKPSMKCML